MRDDHVSTEELARYCRQALDSVREEAVEMHLVGCPVCAQSAREVFALTVVVDGTTAESLEAAYRDMVTVEKASSAPAAAGLARAWTSLVLTASGWMAVGGAENSRPTVGSLIGGWSVGGGLELQGARLAPSAPPIVLTYSVPNVCVVTVEITHLTDEDWRFVLRIVPEAAVSSLVVGLGDRLRARYGTRTLTAERELRFQLASTEIADLHLHLEWTPAAQEPRTATIALPPIEIEL